MEEEVKCNVDDTLFKIDHCFGIDMCLQDVRGHFLTARYDGVPSPCHLQWKHKLVDSRKLFFC